MSSSGALDSSLEALAFGYLSYGFVTAVNNVWAWVAVVTAAVSLWRINRGLGLSLPSSPRGGGQQQQHVAVARLLIPSPPPAKMAVMAEETDEGLCSSISPTSITTSSRCVGDHEGGVLISSSKVKLSLYYDNCEEGLISGSNDHEGVEGDDHEDDDDEGRVVAAGAIGRLGLMWGCEDHWAVSTTVLRNVGDEMGWYRCQDLTVFDGSVVRLWNGRRRRRDAAVSVADGGMAW